MNRAITLCIGIMLFVAIHTTLKAQFKISGEFRPRTEYSHGYSTLAGADQDPSLFTTQRHD